MTLNNIIASALDQLDRSHDAQSIEVWRGKLTRYINDAVFDLARDAIRPTMLELVKLENGTFDMKKLKRRCLKVIRVQKDGTDCRFSQGDQDKVYVSSQGYVTVLYRFVPCELAKPTDEPELPKYAHPLLITYAVAMERMSGGVDTQAGGNVFMSMYEMGKAKLKNIRSASDANEIFNKW